MQKKPYERNSKMTLRRNAEYCKATTAVHNEFVALHYHKPQVNKFFDLEIAYVVSGNAFQITKNKRIPITQGNYLLVDYGIQHGYEIPEGESLELINISFDCRAIGISPNKKSLTSFAKNYSITSVLTDESPREDLVFFDKTGKIKEQCLAILDEYKKREPGYYGVIKGILLEIVISGMRQYFCPEHEISSFSPIVEQLLNYLSSHYMENTSLSELSKKMHFSLPYVSKKFKDEVGKTYTESLHERRINESCRMLFDSDESIETIAEYIGYSDSKKYRKKFKEIVGISPREYKKSLFS